jgi:signal recognition particle receptor subunit beta
MINPSFNPPVGPTSFYLNTEALTEEQKNAHALVLRRSLHQLFRSVTNNQPTNILLWGKNACGKTSFCASIINTIHIHSDNLSPQDDRLNFRVTTNAEPKPIILYPSDLINLMDVSSKIVRDLTALQKTIQFLDNKWTETNAVCLFLDMDKTTDPDLVLEAFGLYTYIKQINRIAILILNKVDLFQIELPQSERSTKLEETLVTLRQYGFDRIVPMTNYREGIHERPNLFTQHSSVEVLYHARFGKDLPLTSPSFDENPPVFGN